MKNGVILCTSVEQGAKIIEYFKSLGVDTYGYSGYDVGLYYGVKDGRFDQFNWNRVNINNIPILTLPDELGWRGENTKAVEITQGENTASIKFTLPTQELPTQELPEINFEGIEMKVSDDGVDWYKAKVFVKINGRYLDEDYIFWNHARPIQQKVKVTKEQIAEAFNTTVDNLEIE